LITKKYKIFFVWFTLCFSLLLSACEGGSSSTGAGGMAAAAEAAAEQATGTQEIEIAGVSGAFDESKDVASADVADTGEVEVEVADAGKVEGNRGEFNLVFEMSYQSCSSCGIWFDSAELVIDHSEGRFTARQTGSLLIKEAPYRQGRFKADISSIPRSANIQSATLYMRLNSHEGIANGDSRSKIAAYGYINGSKTYLRDITAQHDIKGKGYHKGNPVVPIDFTAYARRL
jgi:hypothetical protein